MAKKCCDGKTVGGQYYHVLETCPKYKDKPQHTPTPFELIQMNEKAPRYKVGIINEYFRKHPEIVRAVNQHEELLAIVKTIAESFNAGADKVYSGALAPHSDELTLGEWINQAIKKSEPKS